MADGSQHPVIIDKGLWYMSKTDEPRQEVSQLTLNAHQVIVDLVEAVRSLLDTVEDSTYLPSPAHSWIKLYKTLEQAQEFLGRVE